MAIPNWVTISQNQGGAKFENTTTTITITADTSSELESRTGALTINTVNAGLSATVNLKQEEAKYFYWSGTTSPVTSFTVNATATSLDAYFITNYDVYEIRIGSSPQPMMDITYSNYRPLGNNVYVCHIEFLENSTTTEKNGLFYVYGNNGTYNTNIGVASIVQRPERDYSNEYLTIEAQENSVFVYLKNDSGETIGNLFYSKNGGEWTTFRNGISLSQGDTIRLYGTNSSYNGYYCYCTGGNYIVYGNIMSLLYGQNFIGQTTIQSDKAFYKFFGNISQTNIKLIDCSNLVLPATTLTYQCYTGMFYNCTNITTAPALPATTLANYCYSDMFHTCTSLVNAPVLSATTLASGCYYGMFKECTSLVNAPALPATTLADNCYEDMFLRCTNITTAPALPATTLANRCYKWMFYDCTSLVNAPVLSATTLADYCYNGMFYNCASLVNAPALPATTLTNHCYEDMFFGCSSLVNAPVLSATTLTIWCYSQMFYSCRNLNYIKCLATNMDATYCLRDWTSGVSSSGTFVKKAGVSWSTGTSGIPSGWTVEEV